MGRSTQVLLDQSALLHNLQAVRRLAPHSRVLAMVKAYAYGHGPKVADCLDRQVDGFGVASIEEAILLRKRSIISPIVLMEGVFQASELPLVQHYNLDFVIHCDEQIDWLLQTSANVITPTRRIWLKLDSGMGRLGFSPSALDSAYQRLQGFKAQLGLMSHFACADQKLHPLNQQQIDLFCQAQKSIPGPYSCANSAAILQFPQQHYDWVRPGIMLYGISPFADQTGPQLGLKPVMTVQTAIISIKQFSAGDSIGYGATWCCPETMPIGIVAIGYGDGYPRLAPAGTPVLVNGKRCPIVGRVSMDMLAIDLRPCPAAQIGTIVTLWGNGLPVEEIAAQVGTIGYELVCNMPLRIPYTWSSSQPRATGTV